MLSAEEYKQAEFGLTVEESRRGFKSTPRSSRSLSQD